MSNDLDAIETGVIGRAVDVNNYYSLWNESGYSHLLLTKHVGGVRTTLGTFNFVADPSVSYVLELRMVGNQISGLLDGVEVIAPVTDASFAAAGKAGILTRTNGRVDTLRAYTLAAEEAEAPSALTFDPAVKASNIALSGGNLIATETDGGFQRMRVRTLPAKTTGKWYAECTATAVGSNNEWCFGLGDDTLVMEGGYFGTTNSAAYLSKGEAYANNVPLAGTWNTFGDGAVIGLAVDLDNHLLAWSVNGVWANGANPAAGTGMVDISHLSGPLHAVLQMYSGGAPYGAGTLGSGSYTSTKPAGYAAWS
jgi:hypothetical protein